MHIPAIISTDWLQDSYTGWCAVACKALGNVMIYMYLFRLMVSIALTIAMCTAALPKMLLLV